MTVDLYEVLRDRAASVELAPPDLATISREGTRRIRRRRLALAAVTMAAVAVVAGGLAAVDHGDDEHHGAPSQAPTKTDTGARASVVWAKGSVVHDGEQDIDVGRVVYRLVRTSDGFVFTDYQGRVLSWHDGHLAQVGVTNGPLVSDDHGTLAGWVDGSGKTLTFVVLDQATGAVIRIPGHSSSTPGPAPGGYENGGMIALDGHTAYWRDGRVTYSATISDDWAASTPRALALGARWLLIGVANGIAVLNDENTGAIKVGLLADQSKLSLPESSYPALLSPDGRWLVGESLPNRDPEVYDTASGAPTSLPVKVGFPLVYEWLDDDTVAVLAARTEHTDYQLLACTVSTQKCHVEVADLGEAPLKPGGGNGSGFELPIGDYYFPFPHG